MTGNRNGKKRKESAVITNTISPVKFNTVQANSLSEGLNFCPGLRLENNCQNCGFTQVRMNGMEGHYSQILINSRPVFSGLAGVYGLELIPANMIERVEVVRGGGSVLYGSNAIAGSINIFLKDPITNSYEFGVNTRLIGSGMKNTAGTAPDYNVNFNTSLVSSDTRTGMSLYGFYRDRDHFDANNDGFSELSRINNTTIGSRIFHRFGARNKLSLDLFNINEERRGGNEFDKPLHETDIAEAVDHNILNASLTYVQYFREKDKLSVFFSGQAVKRDSYYGAMQSLSDYGKTKDFTYNGGVQYTYNLKKSRILAGAEISGGILKDQKLGYPVYRPVPANDTLMLVEHIDNTTIADQQTNTFGTFSQYEIKCNSWKVDLGVRYDHYIVKDRAKNGDTKDGNVISPGVNILYSINEWVQARFSYLHKD